MKKMFLSGVSFEVCEEHSGEFLIAEASAYVLLPRQKARKDKKTYFNFHLTEDRYKIPVDTKDVDLKLIAKELFEILKEPISTLNISLDGGIIYCDRKTLPYDKMIEYELLEFYHNVD